MEAIKEYEYSNEKLVRLYKATKDNYYISLLYENNYKIIWKMCNKYKNVNWMYSIDDLLSEAYIGLEKAVEYFVDGSCSFFSFLCVVLNQYLYGVVNGLTSKEKGNKAINNCISVYTALSDDDDAPLIIDQIQDEVAQEEIDKLPEILFFSYLHDLESEAIDKLTDKEKTVTKAINGFESAVYSINEVADMFGVSYSRVQELKSNSYRKLRHNKKIKNIWETEFKYR